MAAYRQNSTAPMGNFNQAAQHPMLEKAEQCNWVKNISWGDIITPFQNQASRSADKVAEVFDRHMRQRFSFWVLLKFTIRFCWAGYVQTDFRGKNLSKMGFFMI